MKIIIILSLLVASAIAIDPLDAVASAEPRHLFKRHHHHHLHRRYQQQSGETVQGDFGYGAGAQTDLEQGGGGLTIQKTLTIGHGGVGGRAAGVANGQHAAKVAGVADAVGQAIAGVAGSVAQSIGHVSSGVYDAGVQTTVSKHQQQSGYGGGSVSGSIGGGGSYGGSYGGQQSGTIDKQINYNKGGASGYSHTIGIGGQAGNPVGGVASIIGGVIGNVAKSVTDSVGQVAHSVGSARKTISVNSNAGVYHHQQQAAVAAPSIKNYETVYVPAPLVPAPQSNVQTISKGHSSAAAGGSFHAEKNFHASASGGASGHHQIMQLPQPQPQQQLPNVNVNIDSNFQSTFDVPPPPPPPKTVYKHVKVALPPPPPAPAHGSLFIEKNIYKEQMHHLPPPPLPQYGYDFGLGGGVAQQSQQGAQAQGSYGHGLKITKEITIGGGGIGGSVSAPLPQQPQGNYGQQGGGVQVQKDFGFSAGGQQQQQSGYGFQAESGYSAQSGSGYSQSAGNNYQSGYGGAGAATVGVTDFVGQAIGSVAQSVADSIGHVSHSVAASKAHIGAGLQHGGGGGAVVEGGANGGGGLTIQKTLSIQHGK